MYLIELSGPHCFRLSGQDSFVLGRSAEADLRIDDDAIEERHAILDYATHGTDSAQDKCWWIEDLGSSEGSYIQGKELTPGHRHPLSDGMRVGLGLREFVCSLRGPVQAAPFSVEETCDPLTTLVSLGLLEGLNDLLRFHQEPQALIESVLDLIDEQLSPQHTIFSLEEEIVMRGLVTSDATTAIVMHRARFQTQPKAFVSVPATNAAPEAGVDGTQPRLETTTGDSETSAAEAIVAMVAPVMIDSLMRGYVYVLSPPEAPWSPAAFRLFATLVTFASRCLTALQMLQRAQEDREVLHLHLVGVAPSMQRLKSELLKRARGDAPVFIQGEVGVGKSRIARAIHQASARRDAPMLVLNAARFPTELFESELCGAVYELADGTSRVRQGMIELAEGGTLLIESINALPLGVQPMLLSLLKSGLFTPAGQDQMREANVRVLCTSNLALPALCKLDSFLPQLVRYLEPYQLPVPPLSQRAEDIPLLFRAFLGRLGEEEGLPTCVVSDEALLPLRHHRWKYNIRELRDVVARCFYELDPACPVVDTSLIASVLAAHVDSQSKEYADVLGQQVQALEHRLIQEALMAANDDIAEAARSLGLSRVVLRRKMRALAIG